MAVQWNAMGTALGKAAQHKLVGLLAAKLSADGIYVGEVVVLGMVKGTRFDSGNATLEASTVADEILGAIPRPCRGFRQRQLNHFP